jgi:hypothetical protein
VISFADQRSTSTQKGAGMAGLEESYGLVVGIANYLRVDRLPSTILNDAHDVYGLLCSPDHCGYLEEHVRVLLDGEATADGIRAGLQWLGESAGPGATAFVFYSGHGGRVIEGPQAGNYLIPYDCDPVDLNGSAISGQELTELLRSIQAQRLLVVFDACYAGGTGETKRVDLAAGVFKAGLEDSYYERLTQGTGRVIMASSRSDEESLVLSGMDNSLFTHFLLKALRGNARTRGDGLIRVFDVFDYVSEEVPARGRQHPIFKATDLENNFPIALYRGGKQAAPATGVALLRRTSVDKRALRQTIVESFPMEDLDIICADVEADLAQAGIDLQVDMELVGGTGKRGKVLNLINYLDRRGYLAYLVTAVRRERPGII